MQKSIWKSADGFSLVEMLVGVAILSVVGAGLMSLMTSMQHENRSISLKSEVLDFERILGQTLSKEAICTCQMNGKTLVPDSGALTPTFHVELEKIDASCDSPPQPLVSKGQPFNNSRSGLLPQFIGLRNLTLIRPNEYLGTVEVAFDPGVNKRAIQAARISKIFTTSGTTIVGCMQAPTDQIVYRQGSQVVNDVAGASQASIAKCDPGYLAVGGGWAPLGSQPASCGSAGVVESRMVQIAGTAQWAWQVTVKCLSYVAVVTCQKAL